MRFWKKQLRIGVWQLACICQPAAWELQNIFLIQTFRRIFQLRCCLNIFIIECVSNWIDETFRFDMRIVINVLVLDVTKSNFDSCLCRSNPCKISFYDAKRLSNMWRCIWNWHMPHQWGSLRHLKLYWFRKLRLWRKFAHHNVCIHLGRPNNMYRFNRIY